VDRCYMHGAQTSSVRRGMDFQGGNMAVVDSYFSDFHDQVYGADSQAILSYCATGPLLIQNNFLSAASENVMFGGSSCGVSGLEPADITIVGNWFWKDYANWFGAGFVVKNLFEIKKAQRALVEGNVFEYSWADAQSGYGFMITPRANGCSTCGVSDITFTHNLVRHIGSGIEIAGSDDSALSATTNRVSLQNNVFTDVSSVTYSGYGQAMFMVSSATSTPPNNLTADHNDMFADHAFDVIDLVAPSATIPNLQLTNNISDYGAHGLFGLDAGYGSGSVALTTFAPTAIYNDNVYATTNPGSYPSGSLWSTSLAGVGFTSYSGTDPALTGNFQLTSGSKFHNAGTDGKDIGVWDWTTFNAETTNALNGNYP